MSRRGRRRRRRYGFWVGDVPYLFPHPVDVVLVALATFHPPVKGVAPRNRARLRQNEAASRHERRVYGARQWGPPQM